MAKLTGPFMSLKASGQLAKTIVAFPWKGINALRTYVIPANPKTIAQRTQRGYFEDAVQAWHDAPYSADDVSAWNTLAGIAAKIMSGFNRMIQEFVNEAIKGNTWERLRNGYTANVQATEFEVHVQKIGGGNAPTCYYGTSKTHFPNSKVLVDEGGATWGENITGLTKNTLYYFYFDVGTSGVDYARLGIYSQRTPSA